MDNDNSNWMSQENRARNELKTQAADAANTTLNKASDAVDQAKDTASEAVGKVKKVASQAADRAGEALDDAADRLNDTSGLVRDFIMEDPVRAVAVSALVSSALTAIVVLALTRRD